MNGHLISSTLDGLTSIISAIGYVGVIILMAAESANIPIPSEVIMPYAGFLVARGDLNLLGVVIAGTLGNWIGSSLSWWLGATGGRKLVDRYGKYIRLNHGHLDQAQAWFSKYGEVSVFFGRFLPVVRTFISLPAGLGRMNYVKFSIYTILGAAPFCFVLAYLGEKLGQNWESIRQYFHYIDAVVILGGIILLFGLYHGHRTLKRSRNHS